MESNTDTLGDQILTEYLKGTSKEDVIKLLNIDDYTYSSWEKINKNELKKIDVMLEKKRLCKTLKIKTLPLHLDSDLEDESDDETTTHMPIRGQYLKKEPRVVHQIADQINQAMEQKTMETEKLVQLSHLRLKQGELQEKINKMIDLESQKKIGKHDFERAMSILREEMNHVKAKITLLEG